MILIKGYYTHIFSLGRKILIVLWYMNDNEPAEKGRSKETSCNALVEIQTGERSVDG